MKADQVLTAIQRHHTGAALVRELVVKDPTWLDTWEPGLGYCTTRRIDGLLVKARQRTAIEVKVTRADYRRESDRKRAPWVAITHRFVYACPEGLIQPQEVPDGLGLWWVDERGHVTVAKRARVNAAPEPMPEQVVIALCYRAMRAAS